MMLEDFRLRVFMAVVQEKSFTKAASILGVTQPAVSQNIAELEKLSGRKLFERQRGEVLLTPQGQVFMEYASGILSLCESAGNMFSSFGPTVVKVSVSEDLYTLYLAPVLESFMTVHPDISFERCMFGDADLQLSLQPAPDSIFELPSDSINRLRISSAGVPKMGDYKATHEKTSYYDILFQPSASFACTRLCRVLKEYLTSF